MLLAAFEPGKEMAIANFFLAIFGLFTIALPLLLITRGDKTKANRDFIAATVNPWSQIGKEIELTPVAVSGLTPPIELQAQQEVILENVDESISESDVISLDSKRSEEQAELSNGSLEVNDEVIAA